MRKAVPGTDWQSSTMKTLFLSTIIIGLTAKGLADVLFPDSDSHDLPVDPSTQYFTALHSLMEKWLNLNQEDYDGFNQAYDRKVCKP